MANGYGARKQDYKEYMKDHEYYEKHKQLKGRKTPKQMVEAIKNKTFDDGLDTRYSDLKKKTISKNNTSELQRLKRQEQSMLNAYGRNKDNMGQKYWLEKYKEASEMRRKAEGKKYSTETKEQLDKAEKLKNINTGEVFTKLDNGQYRNSSDGYDYFIDTNVANKDNPQYKTYKDLEKENFDYIDKTPGLMEKRLEKIQYELGNQNLSDTMAKRLEDERDKIFNNLDAVEKNNFKLDVENFDDYRVEYHHTDNGTIGKVYGNNLSGQQFNVPAEHENNSETSAEYRRKEVERLQNEKNAYEQRQIDGLSRIDSNEYYKKDWGDDVYTFSKGTAWKGSKSEGYMSGKDIAKAVTDEMKKAYPGVKIGRKTSSYSGGQSIDFYISESDKAIVKSMNDFSEQDLDRIYQTKYSNYYSSLDDYKNFLQKDLESGNMQINKYYIDDDFRLTDYGKQVIKDLRKVTDAYNYDESDGMTDYFNTRFYSDISIGTSKKPYQTVQSKIDNWKKKKSTKI